MATHERGKIRIAWVETDAPPIVEAPAEASPPVEAPSIVDETERASIAASRERLWTICQWVVTCGLFGGLEWWVLPAFARMFREVGVSLPPITEAALGGPGVVYGLGVLSLLHAAAVTGDPETRGKLRVAAFLAAMLGVGLTLYALFAPLIIDQKM
jgi:F0F1-type ATP synthase membrane subunit c/vacuolar-type H+-ATPase subunit K